jgi:hypothetical protein
MPQQKPPVSDEIKCKFVVTEIPKVFSARKPYADIPPEPRSLIVDYPEAKTALYAMSACDGEVQVDMTCKELKKFLLNLAEKGLDVREEFDGAIWSFVREIE